MSNQNPANKPETKAQRNERHAREDASLTPAERAARDQVVRDIENLDK